ncbi:hypothetical protein COO59_15095 [Mixta theicola]|uniref:Lipoprotein n=1 Tax=Mixta theicola TaxID=1458355 RepID=A0A2K1Q7C5_9GAMM|nr:putative T6SS immunity periplasmic lipoprotein [Mixta theicola]PNS10932.1 hypothetical protein COO59_15095 [Mixta theicola]GLR11090.1 hypothetical protein GCM10007905_38100 [Mixta theicola]
MKKIMLLFLLILASCGSGDKLQFNLPGDANITLNSICINAKSGEILSYYLLSSSVNQYKKPLSMEDDIQKFYPNMCVFSRFEKNESYTLIYILDQKKYRVEFRVDHEGNIIKKFR